VVIKLQCMGLLADRNRGSPKMSRERGDRWVDFGQVNRDALGQVNRDALAVLPSLLRRWLPSGQIQGAEYIARNPRRADRRPGSFKVNTRTGRWADFATGERGSDPISLVPYLFGLSQFEAAHRLAMMLGVGVRHG
jgi:hypothetical protein